MHIVIQIRDIWHWDKIVGSVVVV